MKAKFYNFVFIIKSFFIALMQYGRRTIMENTKNCDYKNNSKNSTKNKTSNSAKNNMNNNVKTQKSNAGYPESDERRDGPGGN